MLFNMYAVKDEMTQKFMNPTFIEADDLADNLATRQFRSNVNNIQLWKDNPNDFSLYKVGQFDDMEGACVCVVEKICSGRSVLNA